jgi:ribosome modulation factor
MIIHKIKFFVNAEFTFCMVNVTMQPEPRKVGHFNPFKYIKGVLTGGFVSEQILPPMNNQCQQKWLSGWARKSKNDTWDTVIGQRTALDRAVAILSESDADAIRERYDAIFDPDNKMEIPF